MPTGDVEAVEVDLLLEGIFRQQGYDFRHYARRCLERRLWHRIREEGLSTISGLQERALHDPEAMQRLLLDLSVNVTSMFRDPAFYAAVRRNVVPLCRTYPYLRIWNAGCSTGEETYSLAILLHEEGLANRTRLYATDMNEQALDRARAGTFPLDKMQKYTENYIRAGGKRAFSEYYAVEGDRAVFRLPVAESVVFAHHNLATDTSFNEFHLIVCRNVMIYFDKQLQHRVHTLFHGSLVHLGVLGLGSGETIRFMPHADHYVEIDGGQRIYRRVR